MAFISTSVNLFKDLTKFFRAEKPAFPLPSFELLCTEIVAFPVRKGHLDKIVECYRAKGFDKRKLIHASTAYIAVRVAILWITSQNEAVIHVDVCFVACVADRRGLDSLYNTTRGQIVGHLDISGDGFTVNS